ncbi:hypothetical protein VZT92_011221 [Zoarces viviparus]|uniref:Uncharacterized protein n=1 Tax=Zoarces viviparus TaxID=48416 RepID=A0AAW1FB15_ZOAVI
MGSVFRGQVDDGQERCPPAPHQRDVSSALRSLSTSTGLKFKKSHCPRSGGWKRVLGLIVFGPTSGCNYSETSLKSLVWFGQNIQYEIGA